MFLNIFRQMVCFWPPLENFAFPWKKICGHPQSEMIIFERILTILNQASFLQVAGAVV